MRRQIVIAGGLRLFEVQPWQRCFELDRLVGLTALAPDHRLDRFDPVIVARLVIDPQCGTRRTFRRFCKGDFGRVVGNDVDRPNAERGAPLVHLELRAAGKGGRRPEVLLVDGVEITAVAVDRKAWDRLPAMHLSEERAAGRDADGFCGPRPQKLWCEPSVFGRCNPDVEAGGDRPGSPGDTWRYGASETIAPVGSSIDGADQQQHRQYGA